MSYKGMTSEQLKIENERLRVETEKLKAKFEAKQRGEIVESSTTDPYQQMEDLTATMEELIENLRKFKNE